MKRAPTQAEVIARLEAATAAEIAKAKAAANAKQKLKAATRTPGASAKSVVERLDLSWNGRSGRGDCPACGYKSSFVLTANKDGTYAGWCASCGDIDGIEHALAGEVEIAPRVDPAIKKANAERQQRKAMERWLHTVAARSTLAERYLERRGISWLVDSPAIRFADAVSRPDTATRYPAMIAEVTDVNGAFQAIHRIYLAPDGGKAPGAAPVKASLGPVGGGMIRLDPWNPRKPLIIAEGIENAASAGRLLKAPAWSAVSAGNLEQGLVLPKEIKRIVIAADPDKPGERAAIVASMRWRDEGREVRIAHPPGNGDFNDMLLAGGRHG